MHTLFIECTPFLSIFRQFGHFPSVVDEKEWPLDELIMSILNWAIRPTFAFLKVSSTTFIATVAISRRKWDGLPLSLLHGNAVSKPQKQPFIVHLQTYFHYQVLIEALVDMLSKEKIKNIDTTLIPIIQSYHSRLFD